MGSTGNTIRDNINYTRYTDIETKCENWLFYISAYWLQPFPAGPVNTLSERVLCCVMGSMLWYHSYWAGGLASALHSRNRESPSDTVWDWGWWTIRSPLTDPGNRVLLQPDMTTRFTWTLHHHAMRWNKNKESKETRRRKGTCTGTSRLDQANVSPLGEDTVLSMVDPTDIVTLVDWS